MEGVDIGSEQMVGHSRGRSPTRSAGVYTLFMPPACCWFYIQGCVVKHKCPI